MEMYKLPPLPTHTQYGDANFSPPCLDGSLLLPEIYDWHLKNSPNHPLFIYSTTDEVKKILWPEAVRAIHLGARIVRNVMNWTPGMKDPPVVAILAPSETITYFTFVMSIIRAGYIVFTISPRNSAAAVAHLLSKVHVKHVFHGRDDAMSKLCEATMQILENQYPDLPIPGFSLHPSFEDLYSAQSKTGDSDDLPYEKRRLDEVAIVLHSSGTTAFPKPIPWTHHRLLQFTLCPFYGERNLTGRIMSLHVMPMYHGIGLFHMCWAGACGLIISSFEPKFPPITPSTQNHFKSAVATGTDYVFCAPSIVEEWSRRPDYVEWLASRSGILTGGGPLNREAGDYLISRGITLYNLYGTSEVGAVTTILPDKVDYDWEYFRFADSVALEMVPHGEGKYELVVLANKFCLPSVINTKINGVDGYATSDLFIQSTDRPDYWKLYGRTDDQIMHSTGEKTNPGPLENILNQDPHVQGAVIFGRGQFQAGVIIDPKDEYKFDPTDERKLADFRNLIWPTVQRMNELAPQHSRIFKEMIVVSNSFRPFQYTAKMTPRRHVIIKDYDQEILKLYKNVADSAQASILPPSEWSLPATLEFVREVVNKVLQHNVRDDQDIFQHGCDSLQATWIRNTLLRAVRDSAEVDTRHLVNNFVYQHPTISSMASYIYTLATGTALNSEIDVALRASAMRTMVEKYINNLPVRVGANTLNESKGDVVLVTGTTGALGAYLLSELEQNPEVLRIYAINRSRLNEPRTLEERQRKALNERGLDGDNLLASEKVILLEGNLASPLFGLDERVYKEMISCVTHVIHNAWPVDFNLALSTFEASIKGIRNLLEFSLTSPRVSPPIIIFTSSIGVLQNIEGLSYPLKESPIPAEVAVGTGYIESKWVSEELLIRTSQLSPVKSVVVRVGQLAGGLNGCWNTTEWFPSIVQSSQVLGRFPADGKTIDWIPLQMAAKALIDYRTVTTSSVVHLVHPRPIAWNTLAKVIAKDLSVELVSFSEWLEALEIEGTRNVTADRIGIEALRRIPALRLLSFYRSMSARDREDFTAFGLPKLACDEATRQSITLATIALNGDAQLDEKDARSWIQYWRDVEFLKG